MDIGQLTFDNIRMTTKPETQDDHAAAPAPAPLTSSNARGRAPLLLAYGLFALWAAAFIRRTAVGGYDGRTYYCLFDDAMISMRYAWNLAHGLGLVWNPGERVEGCTNFLMTVLMAPFTAVFSKSAAVAAVQLSGVGVAIGVAELTRRLARRLAPGLPPALQGRYELLCAVGALAYYPLPMWSLMGMETGLLTVLLLGALALAFRPGADGAFSPGLGLLLGLAFMTRPDAALLIVPIMACRALALGFSRKGLLILAGELAIIAALGGGLTLFRVFYYGSPVPNTFRLKLGGFPLGFRLAQGAGFIWPLFVQTAPALALAALGLRRPARRELARRQWLLIVIVLILFLYPVWTGGDVLGFWRLSAPAFPCLLALALAAAARLGQAWAARRGGASGGRAFNALTAALLVILCAADAPFIKGLTLKEPPSVFSSAGDQVNMALALEELTGPRATLAVGWGGIVPYYTGRRAIDLLGKCDPHVAALAPDLSGACGWLGFRSVPGHNKYDLNYSIVSKRPTYVQCFTWGRDDVRAFAREHYVSLRYKGAVVSLLKGSPDVRWEKLPPVK